MIPDASNKGLVAVGSDWKLQTNIEGRGTEIVTYFDMDDKKMVNGLWRDG